MSDLRISSTKKGLPPVHHAGDLLRTQRGEVDLREQALSTQFCKPMREGVPPMKLVAAVGAEDQHSILLDRPDKGAQQFLAGLVRPMQVLQQDQAQRLRRAGAQHVIQSLEHAPLLDRRFSLSRRRGRFPELGEQTRQVPQPRAGRVGDHGRPVAPHPAAQRFDHRTEGDGRVFLVAVPFQDLRPALSPQSVEELAHQTRLAHARLARDHDQAP